MSRRFARALASLLALAGAVSPHPALAEVRLVPQGGGDGVRYEFRPTASGPWTAIGGANGFVLNPAGDLQGDGAPGHAVEPGLVVVAWDSPTDGEIELAEGTRTGWRALASLPAVDVFGPPLVNRLTHGWEVLWEERILDPTVKLAIISDVGASSTPVEVALGALVAAKPIGDATNVVTISPGGGIDLTVVVLSLTPDADPIIISTRWQGTLDIIPVSQPMIRSRWNAGATLSGRAATSTAGLPARSTIPARGSIAHASPLAIQIHDGVRRDGSPYALLTWWSTDGDLRFVELREDGPVLPVETIECRAQGSPACVLEATREVRDR